MVPSMMWVQITTEPGVSVAGSQALIRVLTLYLTGADCLTDPHATVRPFAARPENSSSPIDAFTLNVRTVDGREGGLVYAWQSTSDPRFWEATYVFPVPGEWATVITKPTWGNRYPDPCTEAGGVLTVLPATGATPAASPIGSPVATPGI